MENRNKKKDHRPIQSFQDLTVYQQSYKAALCIIKEISPKLPKEERFDLKDQIRRACKSIPALMAEGFAKKHQKKAFKKYLDDAIGECNELIVHLSFVRDLKYYQDKSKVDKLINIYDGCCKQLYVLGKKWQNFS